MDIIDISFDNSTYCLDLEKANLIPTYKNFLMRASVSIQEFCLNPIKYPIKWNFIRRTLKHTSENSHDLLLIGSIALIMTLFRYLFTKYLIRPFLTRLRLKADDANKFPEAFFRCILYSCFWSMCIYYIFWSGEVDYYERPCRIYQNLTFGSEYFSQPVPHFAKLIYVLQSAFYLHSSFATMFMDHIRSDFFALMLHHGVTCSLLICSYFMKFYKIGILVLYVHDATDILMEFAKMNVYLKHRGGKVYMIHEYLANTAFALFTAAWVYFRLYLYPLKVLHSTTWCVYILHKDSESEVWLFSLFNSMLFFLQIIHIYWFYFIMRILFRMLSGQMKEIEDIREKEKLSANKMQIKKANAYENGSTNSSHVHKVNSTKANGHHKPKNE